MLRGKCFHEQLAQLFFTNLMYQTKVAPPLTDTFCQQTLPISRFDPRAHTASSPSEDTCAITGGSIVSSSMQELSPSSICEVQFSDISSHSSAIDQMNIEKNIFCYPMPPKRNGFMSC